MATVTQSDSRSSINTDPLRSFKFRVLFDNPHLSSVSPQFGFMSVDGLSVTTDVISYRQGGDNTTAVPLDARILTKSGWKANRDLEVGDRVIDPFGQESKIAEIFPTVVKDSYRITMRDGSHATACFGHLWEVEVVDSNNKWQTKVVTTLEMKELVEHPWRKVYLPQIQPVEFESIQELPIAPYTLGVLLAEGALSDETVTFASADEEIVDRVRAEMPESVSVAHGGGVKWRITTGNWSAGPRNRTGRNPITTALRDLGLWGTKSDTKFVPDAYKFASIEDRYALLRGYMDGDGTIDARGATSAGTASETLANDIREIVNSLGGRCSLTRRTDIQHVYKGEVRKGKDSWVLAGFAGLSESPFFLSRKAARWELKPKSAREFRRVTAIDFAGEQEVRCIEVTADSHLFISEDYVVSHNTRKLPGQSDFAPISFSKGLAATKDDQGLYNWISDIFVAVQGTGSNNGTLDFRSTVTIYLMAHPANTAQAPIMAAWRIYRAWITSLAFGSLDAGANGVMMNQISLAHEGWDFKLASSYNSSTGF